MQTRWVIAAIVAALPLVPVGAWFVETYWIQKTVPVLRPGLPVSRVENGRVAVSIPGRQVMGEVAQYEDEIFAYLMFDYLRGQRPLQGREVLITFAVHGDRITYPILVRLPEDLARGVGELYQIAQPYPFLRTEPFVMADSVVQEMRSRSEAFVKAYNLPVYKKIESLSPKEVTALARRFIRFKSHTDPRILKQIAPVPQALTREEAQRLAEDIVAVADFYDLPLDFFLGIGAMENNFMNIAGDLGRAVWKKKSDPGDIVLRRRGGRVLVLNEASGVWQITRETLRYAQLLYKKDRRDYSKLPARLRPPAELDVSSIEPEVLTTYAGLLFRNLLDRFHGDVAMAVGAYNGGPGNPNPRYEEGVRLVAEYARKVLEQAAVLRGQNVVNRQLQRQGRR